MRRAIALGALLASGAPVSAFAADPGFLDPAARIFTLAGGGTEPPREGLPAWRVRLEDPFGRVLPLAAMADGSVATVDPDGDPLRVGIDGRVHMLPPAVNGAGREDLVLLSAAPDGSLAAVADRAAWIYRWEPGAAGWTAAHRPCRRSATWPAHRRCRAARQSQPAPC